MWDNLPSLCRHLPFSASRKMQVQQTCAHTTTAVCAWVGSQDPSPPTGSAAHPQTLLGDIQLWGFLENPLLSINQLFVAAHRRLELSPLCSSSPAAHGWAQSFCWARDGGGSSLSPPVPKLSSRCLQGRWDGAAAPLWSLVALSAKAEGQTWVTSCGHGGSESLLGSFRLLPLVVGMILVPFPVTFLAARHFSGRVLLLFAS